MKEGHESTKKLHDLNWMMPLIMGSMLHKQQLFTYNVSMVAEVNKILHTQVFPIIWHHV